MAHYPADTFQEATEIAIEASNQLHGVINGDANAEVTVEDGSKIPSVRKAMVDSLYFKPPIAWAQGEYEDTYNQLREFVDGDVRTWWFAKGATVSTPVLMTTNPATDPNWTLWSAVTLNAATYETQKRLAAEAGLNMVGSFLLGGTVTNVGDVVFYETDGKYYGWGGSLPKVVPAGSTPETSGGIGAGAWADRTDDSLRDEIRETVFQNMKRSYAETGLNMVDGSFEAGGTLVNANDVLLQERTGKAFSGPAGTVAAGTNPASGGFVDKSGGLLRHELATSNGATKVGTSDGGSVQDFIDYFKVGSLNNTSYGKSSFSANTTGYSNTVVGYRALQVNTVGYDNTVFGVQAMRNNTTGNRNTAIGVDALAKNTTGDHNLALGQNALGFNTTGTYNTALGIDALEYGTNNNFNTAIGQYAALNLENSTGNTVCGYNTFQAATSGNSNVAFGANTLSNQIAVSGNTVVGTDAARDNISGTFINAFGYRAARSNTTGTHITAFGDQAAFKNLDGAHNIALGFTAVYTNISGSWNTGVGDNALFSTTGSNNTAIGGYAGYDITTGTHNTFIGYAAGFGGGQSPTVTNTTAIGRGAATKESNTVQLGNPSVVGVGVGANKIHWLATAPSSGKWSRGDVVFNLSVVAGGSMGWMCVTAGDFAGTPPVFKAMPNVVA